MTEIASTAGRRERRKALNRRTLMDCALSLFTERGVGATRIEDITERADVAKGVFYNYFASKDDLVADLLDRALAMLRQSYPELTDEPLLDRRLRALTHAHLEHFLLQPEHIVLFHQARGLIKVRDVEGSRLQRIFRGYLLDLGTRLLGSGHGSWQESEILELGAVIAGTLSGCISYRMAGGLEGVSPAQAQVVEGAVAAWMGQREVMAAP